jgi:hypothetical protein
MPTFNFLDVARNIGQTSSEILRGLMAKEWLNEVNSYFFKNQILMGAIPHGRPVDSRKSMVFGGLGPLEARGLRLEADSRVPSHRWMWHDTKFLLLVSLLLPMLLTSSFKFRSHVI